MDEGKDKKIYKDKKGGKTKKSAYTTMSLAHSTRDLLESKKKKKDDSLETVVLDLVHKADMYEMISSN